ncbi:MAG: aminodeoxychorismate lyase [Sinobacterium sp.]|nr:aminodeoxychorismate lyase [Sinobacterium sp.]
MSNIPLDPTSSRKSPDLSGLLSKVWLNGKLLESKAALPIDDRAAQFGDGVFETMLISQGQCPLINAHLQRLSSGLHTLSIALDQNLLINDFMQALEHAMQFPDTKFRLKIRISRGTSNTAYRYEMPIQANRIVEISPLDINHGNLQQGIIARVCDWRLSDQPALVAVKHLNRLDQVMARSEWHMLENPEHYFEGLMCDQREFLTEGTMSNFFWVCDQGELHTPILDRSGVAGVMRQCILDLCQQENIHCHLSRLTLSNLPTIKALFICNSLLGVIPVNAVDSAQGFITLASDSNAQTKTIMSGVNTLLTL